MPTMTGIIRRTILLLVLLGACFPTSTAAQLNPNELVLLYNRNSDASGSLAQHYAQVRHVPVGRLLGMDLPLGDSISWTEYQRAARRIADFISKIDDANLVRCVVTFYGVPLKIAAPIPTSNERKRLEELRPLRDRARDGLVALLTEMAQATGAVRFSTHEEAKLEEQVERYERLRDQASDTAGRLTGADRAKANQQLLGFIERAEGLPTSLRLLRAALDRAGNNKAGDRFNRVERDRKIAEAALAKISRVGPMSPQYGEALRSLVKWRGLIGLSRWLQADLARLAGKECASSFDSELSLLLWGEYNPYRWQPNLLNPDVAKKWIRTDDLATLMVARIDAPSADIARRMIDEAIQVEKAGLKGKFYIDARGITKSNAYAQYDRDLLELSDLIKAETDIPVVLDRRGPVFTRGSCPNAALYCGWYSLANYVPAFDFQPGAVGYHIASFELRSLRNKNKSYWCAGLLTDGVVATIGPTQEPYLTAFPPPSKFFGLLLTGKYTLVECFYRSKPFNSWRMALLGDPLYRPFAKNPQLSMDDLAAFVSPRVAGE